MTEARRHRRSWSDDELARAVHDARSWRGVLRNLGLYADGPTHVVRREAERLALDVSHFGPGPRWTDDELRAALSGATSWAQLLSSLGMRPESRRSREKVRLRAGRLGLSLDHLARPGRSPRTPRPAMVNSAPNTARLRDAAQHLTVAWFLLRGLWPATPADSRPYDLLLDTPNGVRRVQVKTTTCRASSGSWQVGIGRHAGGGDRHDRKVPYRDDQVDLFAIVDGDLAFYLIPMAAVAGRTRICLGLYNQFVVGSAASLFLGASQPIVPRRSRVSARAGLGAAGASDEEADKFPGTRPSTCASRWTECELRTAVAKATSWADLLRLLGYKPSSTAVRKALRRELQYYEIDTSHFVGQRTWSDQALIEAAATAGTWAELLTALGLSPRSRSCDSVRTALGRLGIEVGRISLGPRVGRDAIGIELPERAALGNLRHAAPNIAASWFLLCGHAVATPCEWQPYDLVVELPGGLKRVQVKTTTSRDARGGWVVRIGHCPDGSPKAADLICYTTEEVDAFFLVDGDLQFYLIPAAAIAGKTSLSLRGYSEFIVGNAGSLMGSAGPTRGTHVGPQQMAS
jgi:PD-(D/E)XK endonuclease